MLMGDQTIWNIIRTPSQFYHGWWAFLGFGKRIVKESKTLLHIYSGVLYFLWAMKYPCIYAADFLLSVFLTPVMQDYMWTSPGKILMYLMERDRSACPCIMDAAVVVGVSWWLKKAPMHKWWTWTMKFNMEWREESHPGKKSLGKPLIVNWLFQIIVIEFIKPLHGNLLPANAIFHFQT